jgi:hypothetical protein
MCFPSHCTHRMQPLHSLSPFVSATTKRVTVAAFSPWTNTRSKVRNSTRQFSRNLYISAVNGLRKIATFPLDTDVFAEWKFRSAETTGRPQTARYTTRQMVTWSFYKSIASADVSPATSSFQKRAPKHFLFHEMKGEPSWRPKEGSRPSHKQAASLLRVSCPETRKMRTNKDWQNIHAKWFTTKCSDVLIRIWLLIYVYTLKYTMFSKITELWTKYSFNGKGAKTVTTGVNRTVARRHEDLTELK